MRSKFCRKLKRRKIQESLPAWTQEAYRPPRSQSKSLLFRGGGGESLDKIFFSQSEHVSSQIWCQKFFPFTRGEGGHSTKKFFPVWKCIKPNLVLKNFPFTRGGGGGVPWQKNFFPVWTCIKPNLVSKIFPFTETRYPPPGPETGYPPGSETGYPPATWTWDSPYLDLDLGPPYLDLDLGPLLPGPGPGTPPLGVDWQTENSTFPHPSDAGGNYWKLLMWGPSDKLGILHSVRIRKSYFEKMNCLRKTPKKQLTTLRPVGIWTWNLLFVQSTSVRPRLGTTPGSPRYNGSSTIYSNTLTHRNSLR